jgi:4-hydroxy-3-polyprenylbenzoate decarboxylase
LAKQVTAQYPEVTDLYIAPGTGTNRMVLLTLDKQRAGQATEVMKGVETILSPYLATKFIVACDQDVNVRDWNDVIWAITTRMDPSRDTLLVNDSTSRAYLDATNKLEDEVTREWGIPIKKDPALVAKIDSIWDELNIL